ncbi:MAG: dienelactone hydrolase family protein, partial [Candidatus Binatia bacterium]
MADDIETLIAQYHCRGVTRRQFIQRALATTGSLAAAMTMLDSLDPATGYANQVDPNDPALISSDIKYSATDGASIGAYVTRPKGDGRRPAVLVIHGWRGQDDHIRDVSRRLAKAGYVALAPDLLSRLGGTRAFSSGEAATEGLYKLGDDIFTKDISGAVNYLKSQSFVRADRIGVTGFCWGGGRALLFT